MNLMVSVVYTEASVTLQVSCILEFRSAAINSSVSIP